MISDVFLNFQKEDTFLFDRMEQDGSHTGEKLLSMSWITMVPIYISSLHSYRGQLTQVRRQTVLERLPSQVETTQDVNWYVEALKPVSLLSLTLQKEGANIVTSIENTLKSVKALKFLSELAPIEWPTVKVGEEEVKGYW